MQPNRMIVYVYKFKGLAPEKLNVKIAEITHHFDIYFPKAIETQWAIAMFYTEAEALSFGSYCVENNIECEAGDLDYFLQMKNMLPEQVYHMRNREVIF